MRGVDGVVFVADSQPDKMDENIESLVNLEDNLREYGYDVDDLPMVIQYNKRDLPGVMPVEELNAKLNTRGLPHFGASATVGNGVFDTLKLIIKLVLEKAKNSASDRPQPAVNFTEQPVAEPAEASQPALPPQPQPGEPTPAPVSQASADAVPEQSPEAVSEPLPDKSDDTGRLPGRSTQPIEVGASAPVEKAAPAEPEPAKYRPYPGSSDPAEGFDKKVSSANFAPSRTEEADDAVAVSTKMRTEAEESVDLTRPAMAPSLKRRGDKKKRGFFKRLFGIK